MGLKFRYIGEDIIHTHMLGFFVENGDIGKCYGHSGDLQFLWLDFPDANGTPRYKGAVIKANLLQQV